MEPAERLAAYLDGELDEPDRLALEAELARDAELRTQLAAMRRGDAALDRIGATPLPPGAEQRLWKRLEPVLDERADERPAAATDGTAEQAAATTAGPRAGGTSGVEDELAARRRQRARRWPAVGTAAAALVGLAVVATAVLPDRDEPGDVAADSEVSTLESAEAPATEQLPGPVLRDRGRSVDGDEASQLLDEDGAAAVRPLLTGGDQAAVAAAYAAALGVAEPGADEAAPMPPAPADDAAPETDGTDDAADAPAPDTRTSDRQRTAVVPPAPLRADGEVGDAARRDVARCLAVLLADEPQSVPVTAELAVLDGEEVVALTLVTSGPDGPGSRTEAWVLERRGCEVRFFTQR